MADSGIVRTKGNYKNKDRSRSVVLHPSLLPTTESVPVDIQHIRITQENHESVVFVWFDPQEQSTLHLVGPLRAINDNVQTFPTSSSCFDAIRSSKEKIFFITSSSNSELIATVHHFTAVEGIFILDPNVDSIKGDFPKLFGIFPQQEELFRVLKETFDVFEQIQLEPVAFEQDKEFLWSQLWKEELINRKASLKKNIFVEATREYYRNNPKIIGLIDEFDRSYRPAEVISWFFRSPFPSRFLHHALRSHNKEQLSICRFLFTDASRFFQQHPKHKSSNQFYRGMKLSSELLDRFEANIGQLVCTSGFFPCTKSRTNALALASLPAYRPDLLPVFFKIDCDVSALFVELENKYSSPLIVFDICTAFRVVYVNRGPMSVIKMTTAGESGKKIAVEYLVQHRDETIQSLLDEILLPPKPPTPPPKPPTPPPKSPTPSPKPQTPPPKPQTPPPKPPTPSLPPKPSPTIIQKRDPIISAEETKARKYVERGEIDRALVAYQRIQPVTARVLNVMGQLCADKKGDYTYALQCHTQALKMQEEAGEDVSDTLNDLGNIYHSRSEFDLALGCHTRALFLRQSNASPDLAAVASTFVGIANAYWARHEYPEAIDNTQRALAIRENLVPPNETSIAATLAMLGNIYQDCGNNGLAIDLCKKALILFERTMPVDSPILADLLHNLGTMQLNSGELDDAYQNLKRVVKIYRRLLPQGHPDRVEAENDLQQVALLYQKNKQSSQTYL